ncbi:hypothetical protein SSX86_027623 [Deinandra increscens subsp. villosa]|uniref:Apyrase 6 n=1 Tax=Deinandra increscens subsp. villosa TaxID=3103831 RepID=A0AAP0GIL0_9ASTR
MRRSNARVAAAAASAVDSPGNNNNKKKKRKMDNSMKLKFRPNQSLRSTNLFSRNQKQQSHDSHLTKSNVFVIGFVTLAFVSSCYFYFNSNSRDPLEKRYRIVIDGGSTGSRIHVFEYLIKNGAPVFDFSGENGLGSVRVSPGLSAFGEDPHRAGASVLELLDFARKRIPKVNWGKTEVRLMATAGLRMLDSSVQERILESCRKVLRASGFAFRNDWASVISGSDEGVHAWVVANYALGTLGGDPHKTTGIIELGGASAQLTFFSSEPIPPEFSRMVKFGNVSYSLYSHSLLEFGQNVAFDLVRQSNLAKVSNLAWWVRNKSFSLSGRTGLGQLIAVYISSESFGSKVLQDPCSPKGYKHNLITGNLTPSSLAEKNKQLSILHSSGNFSECRSASLSLLQKGKEKCPHGKCYIGSTFIPKLQGNFLATENFFHTSKFFGLSPKTFLSELMVAGKEFCDEDWSKTKSKYPNLNDEDLHRFCFSSAYIVALLHDSLGIAFDDKRIMYANQVNNIPLDWALGAFIFQITSELDPGRLHPTKSIFTMDFSMLSGLIFVILLLFFVYYVSKWRKPSVKTIYDLEKGKYIVTRVESFGSKVLQDPCSPKGYKHNLITGNITPSSLAEKNKQLSILHSSGNFSECRSASLSLLQKGKEKCPHGKCYIGSTFIPKLQGNFLATENFFHTSKFFGLSPKTFLSELMVAGKEFCDEDWSKTKSKYPNLNDEDLHRFCFSSAYIVALLHDSLGIAFDDKRIMYANQVNNIPLDWALGAFIFQITSELDPGRLHPTKSIFTMDFSMLSGLIFVILLLFFVYYVSKWRKPSVKTIYDLEKGKYIVTRVGRQS